MFEQRLTHDELGVAIRKISHSGKAQLRYVKCVALRPVMSDFVAGNDTTTNKNNNSSNNVLVNDGDNNNNNNGGNTIPGIGTYLDKANTEAKKKQQQQQSDNVSVSSSVSSRFMDRIKAVVGGGRSSNAATNNNGGDGKNASSSSIHGGGDNADEDDDNNSLLLHHDTIANTNGGGVTTTATNTTTAPNKSSRALTWGKKNAITIPLDKFTCVRKGKTTDRTCRNGASSSRLLSIVVGSGDVDLTTTTSTAGSSQQESLDIEAPTRLDRDKFASAFARFLGVPLIEEDEGEVVERVGRNGVGSGELFVV